MRCVHEASLHEENSFITLTYSPENLPKWGSLEKTAYQKFMKRLRKRLDEKRVRYFHCGEYGEQTGRPHYHACLFGHDFEDKRLWTTRNDLPVWRSETLEQLWPYGLSEIGTVTFESAAYVARYITKKVTGHHAREHYQRVDPSTGEVAHIQPEYTTMSRRPGIGKGWYDKYKNDVYPSDQVIVRGKPVKPPKYYDNLYEIEAPDAKEALSKKRQKNRNPRDETPQRMEARETCTRRRLNSFAREVTQ